MSLSLKKVAEEKRQDDMLISETIAPVTVHVIQLAPGTNKGAYAQLQQNPTCDQPGYFLRVNDNNIFGRNLDNDYLLY